MLLRRYADSSFIYNLDLPFAVKLINYAIEQERLADLKQEYYAVLPIMCRNGKYKSFTEYKALAWGENIDTRPTEVILAELDAVEAQFKKGDD